MIIDQKASVIYLYIHYTTLYSLYAILSTSGVVMVICAGKVFNALNMSGL